MAMTRLKMEIPKTYGIDDVPLVIQDRSFSRDGSLRYISYMHDRMAGVQGGTTGLSNDSYSR